MSADNGIYILHTKDKFKEIKRNGIVVQENCFENHVSAFRVSHTQAIDNFEYYEKNQIYMLGKYMYDVWGKSKVYYSQNEAFEEAQKRFNEIINSDFPICEYGIQIIDATKYSFN